MDHPRDEDGDNVDASMISNSSPYQATTEPVSDRTICAGFILDTQFVKSLAGVLKLVEILLCIIVLICLGTAVCGTSCSGIAFLRTIAIWGLVFTILMYLAFALTLNTKLLMINWSLTDLINAAIDSLLFLIASITLATQGGNSGNTAGLVFGFFAAVAYGVSAWLAYRVFVVDQHKRRSHVSHIAVVRET